MIIKTETGWRAWELGVINLDGHAVQTGLDNVSRGVVPVAIERSTHWMLLAKAWGSYLRLPTKSEVLEEHRVFWAKTVLKVNNGTPRRTASGTLIVTRHDGTVLMSI